MRNIKIKNLLNKAASKNSSFTSFIPYIDNAGNKLQEEDILFTDKENYYTLEEKGSLDDVIFYTVSSPDITAIYDDTRIFPEAVMTSDGKRFPIKVSKYTHELLPKHAGSAELLDIVLAGPPSTGKTITTLEYSDPSFHNMLASQTSLSIQNDLPLTVNEYEVLAKRFFSENTIPPSTLENQHIDPYIFYLSYNADNSPKNQTRRLLLRLQDIDGEAALNPERLHKISFHNNIIVLIGANDLINEDYTTDKKASDTVKNNTNRYRPFFNSINNLITELYSRKDRSSCKLLFVLTKADLLFDEQDLYLENSMRIDDGGKMTQTIHAQGFDFKSFKQRSDSLKIYLKKHNPNFYNTLKNNFAENQVNFSLIANIGCEPDENGVFEALKPFAIDEPLLYLLSKLNFYPVLNPDDSYPQEDIEGCFENSQLTTIFNNLLSLKNKLLKMIK